LKKEDAMSKEHASTRSNAEWDRLVDEWLTSGEKQKEFVKARGINLKTFQGRVCRSRKRRGLSRKGKRPEAPLRFVEVTPPSPPSESTMEFGACRITMHSTKIEFTSMPDAGWIAEILSKMGESGR
jgi:hypothetical protein